MTSFECQEVQSVYHGLFCIMFTYSVALVCEQTIPIERPPLVGEVSANFLRIEGWRVVGAADRFGRNLGFLDRSRYFFQVAPQLYS
jgi:hypothetical protein